METFLESRKNEASGIEAWILSRRIFLQNGVTGGEIWGIYRDVDVESGNAVVR